MNGLFSPKAVAKMQDMVRQQAQMLIDNVLSEGRCDFVADVAQYYPSEIFLKLLGIPLDQCGTFMDWVDSAIRSADPAIAREASVRVADFIAQTLAERKKAPGDDILSHLLLQNYDGRPLEQEELVGISVLLFIGGLDTVVALLSFVMLYLAEHPGHQRELVDNPELIPDALEEMIRRFSISAIFRYVAEDTCFSNIEFKKGDRVLIQHFLYGIDDREIDNPLEVDFHRPVSRHTAFGAGPHRCLGSHLARLELRVFLAEWLQRIPEFSLATGTNLSFRGGKVIQPVTLPLTWACS
ncbi:cytochrome P450 [Sphingobium sp. SCG-1]|uniref:cytochrome P450 n=1 Tax=Sphingobium sp. SCG-1 TaxID=2072936 RepID=UPI00166F71C1|nr:cytochrome P450 [Sphingobium sp. SCG-1]